MSNYHLVYVSKNIGPDDREEFENWIESAVAVVQSNNPAIRATGGVLTSDGFFCQVLKGREDTLDDFLYSSLN